MSTTNDRKEAFLVYLKTLYVYLHLALFCPFLVFYPLHFSFWYFVCIIRLKDKGWGIPPSDTWWVRKNIFNRGQTESSCLRIQTLSDDQDETHKYVQVFRITRAKSMRNWWENVIIQALFEFLKIQTFKNSTFECLRLLFL